MQVHVLMHGVNVSVRVRVCMCVRACARVRTTHTQRGYLPQDHTIGPNIGGSGELSQSDTLDGHPLQLQAALGRLHILLLHLPGHTKVCDLQHLPIAQENIPARQVSMDDLHTGQVLLQ